MSNAMITTLTLEMAVMAYVTKRQDGTAHRSKEPLLYALLIVVMECGCQVMKTVMMVMLMTQMVARMTAQLTLTMSVFTQTTLTHLSASSNVEMERPTLLDLVKVVMMATD